MPTLEQLKEQALLRVQRGMLLQHFDANETGMLERELEVVRAMIIEIDYPELKAKTFFPKATDIPISADTYIWKVLDKTGHARVSANGVDDFPRVELSAEERSGRVRQTTDSYGWELNEMREATRTGMPLQSKKALAANEMIQRLHDDLFATGRDPNLGVEANNALGIPGAINNPDVANGAGAANSRVVALPNVSAGMDGQDALDALNALIVAVPNGSKQLYHPDTLLLPSVRFNVLATKRINDFDPRTIIQAFLAGNPWIKNVDFWSKLDGAGVDGKDRAMVYKRSKDVVEIVEPVEYEQLPPQARNAEFVVPCLGRCGGTKIYKPLAVAYGDFAAA